MLACVDFPPTSIAERCWPVYGVSVNAQMDVFTSEKSVQNVQNFRAGRIETSNCELHTSIMFVWLVETDTERGRLRQRQSERKWKRETERQIERTNETAKERRTRHLSSSA
jgi:hypothetical protein